jgi:hypothetical protein
VLGKTLITVPKVSTYSFISLIIGFYTKIIVYLCIIQIKLKYKQNL